LLSPATQKCGDRHETADSSVGTAALPSIRAFFHDCRPPVGLVEVRTFPFESTATHSEAEGHEIAASRPPTCTRFQACALAAGVVEVRTSPALSSAAQSDAVGHDTATSSWPAVCWGPIG
jgi:hypothetical protein